LVLETKKGKTMDGLSKFAIVVAVAIALPSAADAASVKEIFEKHNLVGTFAWDCSKPVSKNNWYFVNRVIDENHIQRDLMEGESSRTWFVILDRAWEQSANEIGMSGTRGQEPVTGLWRLDGSNVLQWDATRSGKQEVKEGKLVAGGMAMPRLQKCSG
jgi:hypothetical protein